MIIINTTPPLYILHDELSDDINNVPNNAYAILNFPNEIWMFYKSHELKQVGIFDNINDAINYFNRHLTAT